VSDVDNGKMDGFDKEQTVQESCAPSPAPTDYVYRTMEESEVAPYWQMGEQYVLADRMFEPTSSASYGPHLFLVAGQSANTIDNPSAGRWGCDNTSNGTVDVVTPSGGEVAGVFPCFAVPSFANVLDRHGLSWRFYATNSSDFGYDWSAYDSFSAIRNGPDWSSDVINPPAQIITDVQNGTLAAMTWVTPTNATSDHPQAHSNLGPAWIASVVNAIGASPFWNSTAIFITWDDWGGWYDHVPPPVTNVVGLGVRVPLIVVSPYARTGYVSHVVHTSGSLLHFAEEVFDVEGLGQEDAREDDLMDAFDFTQTPRVFHSIAHRHTQAEIVRAASAGERGEPVPEGAGD
jgi:phospholipase C